MQRQAHPRQRGAHHHLKLSKAEMGNVNILQGVSASPQPTSHHKIVESPLIDGLRRGVEKTLKATKTARDVCQLGSSGQT